MQRQDSAELGKKADISDDDLKFRVISPPILPRQPSGPNRVLLYTVTLVIGFAGGLGLAFIVSQFSPVLTRAEQLSALVSLPIYGTVADLEIASVRKKQRKHLLIFLALSSILLATYGALVLLSMMNINLYERFM